jgi:hypothetical protein
VSSKEFSGSVAAKNSPNRTRGASELCCHDVLVAAYFDYECAKEAIPVQQKF